MWYEWLVFGVVFLLIPIAIANLKLIAEKKINPTEEQKKNANLFCGFLMFFYWLCDLFYMAFILDSLTLKFIFGGLIMLIIFYRLKDDKKLRKVAQTSDPQVFAQSIFPKTFDEVAQDSYVEQTEAFTSLFQNKSKYKAIMSALAGMLYKEFNRPRV